MPTTIPISAWSGKFSLFRRCCTSLREISAPELLGLPARKRFFPNYERFPTAAIPKLPMETKKMNTTTSERGAPESPRSFSGRRPQHHVTFFCNAPGAKSVRLVGDFNGWDLAATPMQRMPDGRWTVSLELHHGH